MTRVTRKQARQLSKGRAASDRPTLAPPRIVGRTAHVLVVDTFAVDGPRGTGISHYEITTAPDAGLDAPRRTFLTRSEDLFHQAVELEGRQQRVDLTWHYSRRPTGADCYVLDAFEEAL